MTDSFDASEINNWSDTADADHKLPELISRLILATLPEPPSRIDMPSGSSVRLPGWDGLLEVGRGNAWAPSGDSGWEFTCEKAVTSKANDDYKKRTIDPLGLDKATATFVFVTSRRWPRKRQWERERREEGKWGDVRAYDADDLATWLGSSPEVTRWFAGVIGRSAFDYEIANRIETRQIETKDAVTAGFSDMADMRAELRTLIISGATQAEPPDLEPIQDPEQRKLSERIDAARELIQQGLIVAARTQLERICDEAEELSDTIRFRLVTNLAVCALGENKFDEASSLLDEAHKIQPENQAGITNAALAAQLQQNPKRAAELAQWALTMDPHDSNAAANLIWALWEMGESEQLEGFVASEEWITREPASASALAGIRTRQSRYEEAITVYRSLIQADPDDPHAHLCLSQCLLAYAQVDRLPVGYDNEVISRLDEAEVEADRAVALLHPAQLYAQRREALVVRAGARALLGLVDEAMRDVDAVIVEEPRHSVAAHHKGLLLLKKGQPGEARKWLESVEDPEVRAESLLALAGACLESGDPTAAIAILKGSFKLDPPGWEDLGRAESLMRAESAARTYDSVSPVLEAAIQRFPANAMLFILVAVRSNLQGDAEGSATALVKAIGLAGDPHRQAIQTQLGHLYASMGRSVDAAAKFGDACGGDASHPAAIPMLLSLFNSGQYREALDLAQNIRNVDGPTPRAVIEVEAEILGYVGDAERATLRHRELCSRDDSTPEDRVRLAMAQFRCGDRDAALETILAIDVSELGRDSQALMKLAHMKRFFGAADYIEDAYLSRRFGINDPATHLGYFRLFQGREEDWEEPAVVEPGCSVLIKSDDEQSWWQILEDGEERYESRELSPSDDLAIRLLGRSVGDVLLLREEFGGLSCEITAIQSKYVRAYQETAEEFSTRFPGNRSLSRVKLDNDFTQIFQSIELRNNFVRNAEELYCSKQLPFASFCSLIGSSTLEVWPEYTAQPDKRLHFGTGSDQETVEARDRLRDAGGIVLDMIALLTVHKLGLAELLRKRFQRVAIPQQVFDEIQNYVYTMRLDRNPSSYMGKDEEGRYTMTDIPEEIWKRRQEYTLSVLELAESIERIPSYPMLAANEPEKTMDALTPAGAGAVYSGDEHSEIRPVLISDDLLQFHVARYLGMGTANTQDLLQELLRSGLITDQECSSRVEQLVLLNYWFVRIGAQDILNSLETNGYRTTKGTQAMLQTLRGPDCSEDAAASVGAEVVASLAKGPLLPEHLEVFLSLVVAEIRSGRQTNRVILKFRNEIGMRLQLAPLQCTRILQALNLYM